jgi:hypothetical protein
MKESLKWVYFHKLAKLQQNLTTLGKLRNFGTTWQNFKTLA